MRVAFPYDEVPPLDVPDGNVMGVFGAADAGEPPPVGELVSAAVHAPIGASPLRTAARGSKKVLIVVDDVSRPTPAFAVVPAVIEELHAAGVSDDGITFLMALGSHRPMTRDEMAAKLGEAVVKRYVVENHDWQNLSARAHMGKTAEGVDVWINRKVSEADFVIGVGRIMPIDVCAFTGGGKILIPGVCGGVTNAEMHWTRVDLAGDETVGKRDNPVRASIDAMARRAGLSFIVNVIMDSRRRVHHVVAGDMVAAHRRGCELALATHAVNVPEAADIVVADSYPFDIEFWQANKALDHAGMVVRKGGVIVLVSPCTEGFSAVHGEMLEFGYPPIDEIKCLVASGRIKHKVVGVHMAQVSSVARDKARLILVTRGIPEADVRRVGFRYAATPQRALDEAFEIVGRGARVAILEGAAEMLPIVGVAS